MIYFIIWIVVAVIFGGIIHYIMDVDGPGVEATNPVPILGLFWPVLLPLGFLALLFTLGTKGVSYLIKKGLGK